MIHRGQALLHGALERNDGQRVSVVMPSLDAAADVAHVLVRIPDCVDEVILVDRASGDDTIAVAQAVMPEIRVVRHADRRREAAVARGFEVASGDVVVVVEADGSTDPAEIPAQLGGGLTHVHQDGLFADRPLRPALRDRKSTSKEQFDEKARS
jgi:glycosyltransferase involved in cell wall biosynthesis